MANRLSVLGILALGILALFAAVPASASTFFQFAQNPGTPTPLIVDDNAGVGLAPGNTTVSLRDALILWDMPNSLGTGVQAGLLSFHVTSTKFAVGKAGNNTLTETGFTGTGSIVDPVTHFLILSWSFNLADSTALTVANNGYTGSFVDSSPIHVVSAPYINQPYLLSSDFASLRFNIFFTAHDAPWTSNGLPVVYSPAFLGTCTNCRIAPNEAVLDLPEPATMAMLGCGLIGLGLLGRKRFVR
jgi:hypothetical protein